MSGSPSKSPVRTVSGATNAAMEPVTPQSESGIRMELVVGEKPPNYTGKVRNMSAWRGAGGGGGPNAAMEPVTPQSESGIRMELVVGEKPPNYTGKVRNMSAWRGCGGGGGPNAAME